jgi:DNA-binding helix-hairpin-helix protein with protein kinase domain
MVCGADITSVNLEDRLFIAYNICAAVDTVHSFGQVCGDLNPQNICVNLDASDSETGLMVTLVDTDSYHIVNGRMMYRCEVGQSNYLPPELQNRLYQGESLSTMALPTYSRETDRFALAVHLFSLFMNGCHPFACAIDMSAMDDFDDSVEVPQPSENIREGFIPFIHHKPGITYPAYAPEFTSLPDSFQKLFIRTFVDGHTNPSVRVSAREWMQAIMEVLQNKSYIKCPQGHIYFIHKMECPYCDMSRRNQHLREQVAPPPIIKEPEEETQQPPAQIPLEHSPAGWQSTSSEKQSRPAAREPKEAKEFNFGTFIEEHIIHIVYGCIILFIVLFVAWYMGS